MIRRVASSLPTNTEFERLALENRINLSDGHARQPLSPRQRQILATTATHLEEARQRPHPDIESEFLELFLSCAGQARNADFSRQYLNYSASSAIALAAQLCRLRGQRALLIEPCFDNIRHLLISHGVAVEAVPEEALFDVTGLSGRLDPRTALWIIQPNNPTGFCLSQSEFETVAEAVAASGATLVIDFTFRFFATSLYQWRQYDFLDQLGVDYLAIEDTGKTWSAADFKVGLTICAHSSAHMVHTLHDQLLLNLSPVLLLMLRDFLLESVRCGVAASVREVVDQNRAVVRRMIDEGLVRSAAVASHNVPLEFLELPESLSAFDLWSALRPLGVDVLPGANYYWSRGNGGRNLFRVPLSRPRPEISEAIPIIESVIRHRV